MNKFKVGDVIYYTGAATPFRAKTLPMVTVKKDTPYKVIGEERDGIQILVMNRELTIDPRYWIIEEEYNKTEKNKKDLKKVVEEKKKKPAQTSNDPPVFKKGDIVYFVGDSVTLRKDTPYMVDYSFDKGIIDGKRVHALTLKSKDGSVFSHESGDFISEDDYEETKSDTKNLTGNKPVKGAAFRTSELVYYAGNNKNLKGLIDKNVPYAIEGFQKGEEGTLLAIRTDKNQVLYIPQDEFVSKDDYLQNKSDNTEYTSWEYGKKAKPVVKPDDEEEVEEEYEEEEKKEARTDAGIKLQLFKDTKDGKILWKRPFNNQREWFRSFVPLEKPHNAALRFDLKKPLEEWELLVVYIRGDKQEPVTVRKMRESKTLKTLVNIVEKIVFQAELGENEEEDEDAQFMRD